MKIRSNCLFILLFLALNCSGQSDSLNRLSIKVFLQMVKQNHPLVKQANLIVKSAEANTLLARGSFDPELFYDFQNKYFDSKNYYKLENGGFKIPTWFGVEVKTGFEQNQGTYLNPENTLPNRGLLYSKISVPLLQGLIIDERRSLLKQAKLFEGLSVYEKINAINEVLYKAGKVYLDWQLAYSNLQVYRNSVVLSQDRFDAIRKTSLLGDRPAIDTVEAIIQLQDRIINLEQALLDYRSKSLQLSNFLWMDNDIPIELADKTIPDAVNEFYEDENSTFLKVAKIDSLINVHPSLKIMDFKLKQLDVERRFKQDKLKPDLNFNYNPLFNAENSNLNYKNNYKWGISVGFPIFLRKERGGLQLTKIKIENTKYEVINKKNELLTKTKLTINEFSSYKNQTIIYKKNAINYERLWQSEKQLFDLGESSLFMVNSREMSFINANIKLNEIISKTQKALLDVEFSFGLLSANY